MADLRGLDLLARFAPLLFGKALSWEAVRGAPVSGRSDSWDARTPELREALAALSLLYRLHETHRQEAEILYEVHVRQGPESRTHEQTWVDLYLRYYPHHRKTGLISADVRRRWVMGGLSLYGRARGIWLALSRKAS